MLTLESEKRKKIIILASIVVGLLVLGSLFSSYIKKPHPKEIVLKVWGFESPAVMNDIFEEYKKNFSHISFEYTQKTFTNYETELLDALSSGNGPDIFFIHNDWLPRYKDKLSPFFSETLKPRNITDSFVDAVYKDLVDEDKLWALPSYIDTLALYYNKDIFNDNNIALPPKTWQEFIEIAQKLTIKDLESNQIKRSGGAIGSAKNIDHSEDLFNLLFLQFLSTTQEKQNLREILKKTISFYTSFANPKSENYIWDKSLHYSIDAFGEQKVAMIFAYHFQQNLIKSKNPNLNFQIVKIPQIKTDNPVNFADYWAWGVSKFSSHPREAWNFILALTNNPFADYYLKKTNRPPVLRSLIKKYLNDPDLGLFCSQALTVKNIVSRNNNLLRQSIAETIEKLLNGSIDLRDAADLIGEKMNL